MRERVLRIKGRGWLEHAYRAYYHLDPPIVEPEKLESREFAFQPFDTDSYVRHLSFMSMEELKVYLRERHPRQAYYSIALYQIPDARSMEEKGWLGSELLVDLDPEPGEECTIVNGVPGDDCLEWAYREAVKIRDILERDLGAKTTIYFTGHRGFHIKAYSSELLSLGREARRLIASYISGEDLDPEALMPKPRKGASPASPSPDDPGWRGWIARILGIEPGRDLVRELGREWADVVRNRVEEWRPRIDYQVTQDPTRLARLLGSLNGKASLLAIDASHGFRADYRVLSPFRGTLEVVVNTDIQGITLLGYEVDLRRGRREEAPAWLAVLLESKGLLQSAWGELVVRRPRDLSPG